MIPHNFERFHERHMVVHVRADTSKHPFWVRGEGYVLKGSKTLSIQNTFRHIFMSFHIVCSVILDSHCSVMRELPWNFNNKQHSFDDCPYSQDFLTLQRISLRLCVVQVPEKEILSAFNEIMLLSILCNILVLSEALGTLQDQIPRFQQAYNHENSFAPSARLISSAGRGTKSCGASMQERDVSLSRTATSRWVILRARLFALVLTVTQISARRPVHEFEKYRSLSLGEYRVSVCTMVCSRRANDVSAAIELYFCMLQYSH